MDYWFSDIYPKLSYTRFLSHMDITYHLLEDIRGKGVRGEIRGV
jgi:hypothetical protein